MKMPTPKQMRARFAELTGQAEKIRANADPLREARDKLAADHAKAIESHNAKIAKAEDGLFDIEQERAQLVRALGGKMGEPEAAE